MSIKSKQFIRNFSKITKKDVNIAGGKGASLGEIIHLQGHGKRINVPSGFVILAKAFDRFLEETDLDHEIKAQIKKVNYNDINSVNKASNIIRDLIRDSEIPNDLEKEIKSEFKSFNFKLVAIRSSATAEDSEVASWAGELESYLNTTEKTLIKNIKNCWSSLFTSRAIFYRNEKNLIDSNVGVAVVVQEMVESEISGITFTVHPVTKDKNQMIIEAGWGLGEAIVSGSITPDAYVLNKLKVKNEFEILDINVNKQEKQLVRCLRKGVKWISVPKNKQEKQKIIGKQIIELAQICISIENHYKKPQDIEWAFKDGKFYVVQSRPITTL